MVWFCFVKNDNVCADDVVCAMFHWPVTLIYTFSQQEIEQRETLLRVGWGHQREGSPNTTTHGPVTAALRDNTQALLVMTGWDYDRHLSWNKILIPLEIRGKIVLVFLQVCVSLKANIFNI